jgi:hypothetical protein
MRCRYLLHQGLGGENIAACLANETSAGNQGSTSLAPIGMRSLNEEVVAKNGVNFIVPLEQIQQCQFKAELELNKDPWQ